MKAYPYQWFLLWIGGCMVISALMLSSAIRSLKPTVTITVPQTKTTIQIPEKRGEFYLPPAVQK